MREAGYPLHPEQLLKCQTEVYGLISGPSWLRQSLVSDLEDLGYVRNYYDKCVMTLPVESAATTGKVNDGVILIEVDDLLEGGSPRHRKLMEKFYTKYKCGKKKRLVDLKAEGTLISGIRVHQHQDFSFTWNMNEYARDHMKPIMVARGFATHAKEIDNSQLSQVMSVNGKIGWLGGNGRPDIAAGHSIIAGGYKTMAPDLIAQCNQCVKQALENSYSLKIWPIPK